MSYSTSTIKPAVRGGLTLEAFTEVPDEARDHVVAAIAAARASAAAFPRDALVKVTISGHFNEHGDTCQITIATGPWLTPLDDDAVVEAIIVEE